MKRLFFLVLILIAGISFSHSQVTFEKQYDFWDFIELTGVYPLNDGYMICGTGRMDDDFYFVMRTDLNGDTLFTKKYFPEEGQYNTVQPLLISGPIPDFYLAYDLYYSIYLQKFNYSGDTIWTKRIKENCFLDDVIHSDDNNLIFLGNGYNDGKLYIIKSDLEGNIIFEDSALMLDPGIAAGCIPKSLIEMPDGRIKAAVYYSGLEYFGDQTIFTFSNTGDSISKREVPSPLQYYGAMIYAMSPAEDEIIAIGANMMFRFYISKLTGEDDTLWVKYYMYEKVSGFFDKLIKCKDGNYLMAGSVADEYSDEMDAGLFTFTADGDSLWYRIYRYDNYSTSINAIAECEDGGFAIVGMIDYSPLVYKGIFLKTDEFGLISQPGIPELYNNFTLGVYPNPASEGLSVKVLGLSAGNISSTFNLQTSLIIYDIFGRAALSLHLGGGRAGDGGWQVDVSALPPGIYLMVLKDERTVLGTAKFIIAR